MEAPLVEYNQFLNRLPLEKSNRCHLLIFRSGRELSCTKCSAPLIAEMPFIAFNDHFGGICCQCYINDRIYFFTRYLCLINEIVVEKELCTDVVNYLKEWCRNFFILNERYYATPDVTLEDVIRWRLPLFWSGVFTIEFKHRLITVFNEGRRLNYIFCQDPVTGNWKRVEKEFAVRGASFTWDHLKNFMKDMIENGNEKEFTISDSVVEISPALETTVKKGLKSVHVIL